MLTRDTPLSPPLTPATKSPCTGLQSFGILAKLLNISPLFKIKLCLPAHCSKNIYPQIAQRAQLSDHIFKFTCPPALHQISHFSLVANMV